jgi:hypothetical protein
MIHVIRSLVVLSAFLLIASSLAQAEDGVVRPEAVRKTPAAARDAVQKVQPRVQPDAANRAAKIKPAALKISPADKKAIIAAFKDVDPSKYRLKFGNETYGKAPIKMQDVKQVKKITAPGEDKGWIVLVVEGDSVIYVFAVGSDLSSVVGAQKAAQLQAIKAKYQVKAPEMEQQLQQPGMNKMR